MALGGRPLLARDAENPAKVREYTKKITASGQRLLSLINDILLVVLFSARVKASKMVSRYSGVMP